MVLKQKYILALPLLIVFVGSLPITHKRKGNINFNEEYSDFCDLILCVANANRREHWSAVHYCKSEATRNTAY